MVCVLLKLHLYFLQVTCANSAQPIQHVQRSSCAQPASKDRRLCKGYKQPGQNWQTCQIESAKRASEYKAKTAHFAT